MNIYLVLILAFLVGNYLLDLVVRVLTRRGLSPDLPEEFRDLMDAENGSGPFGDRVFNESRVEIEGIRLDVHEHGQGAAIADAVRGRDERMADGDDFIAGLDADGQQRQMQGRGAVRNGAGVLGADKGGKSLFEAGDGGTLTHPSRAQRLGDGRNLLVAHRRLGDWYHCRRFPVESGLGTSFRIDLMFGY